MTWLGLFWPSAEEKRRREFCATRFPAVKLRSWRLDQSQGPPLTLSLPARSYGTSGSLTLLNLVSTGPPRQLQTILQR